MNQGRIWCVVNPTVGLPLFIGGVAVTSLVVHASVMTHTTWMSEVLARRRSKDCRRLKRSPRSHPTSRRPSDGYVITVTVSPDVKAKVAVTEDAGAQQLAAAAAD